ncbi:MAG: serine/threonine-protein kinase, partial [bacterium]
MTEPADTLPSGDSGAGRHTEAYCPECGQSFPPDHLRCPNDATRLVKLGGPADPLIGRVFEQRYEVRSRLGEGGMGAVYRGWQLSVDREVAIKVIDPRLSGDRGVVKRFLREARLSSRLSQPSIVNVYDFGQTEDGILYIVMELLRGHTLGAELTAHRALGVVRAAHITVQLCDALDAAHKQGIVHRDLKPGNVMILDDPPGRDLVKVLDFGLAKSLGREAMSKVTHSD